MNLPFGKGAWVRVILFTACIYALVVTGGFLIGWLTDLTGLESHWLEGVAEKVIFSTIPEAIVYLLFSFLSVFVFEEMALRGILYPTLRRYMRPLLAALVWALFFAALHTQYSLPNLISVFWFGMVACWGYTVEDGDRNGGRNELMN